MEYRQGKCAGCGAEYKIPASFQHDAAKCKECGGVVHIAPSESARARSGAGPAPARKPAPRREPRPESAPQPTPLERMKAERAAAPAEAHESTLERLKAERGAPPPPPAAPAPAPAAAAPRPADSRTVAASVPPLRVEVPKTPERAGAGRAVAQKKPSLALRAVALILVLGGAVAGFLYFKGDGAEDATPAATESAEPAAGTDAPQAPPAGDQPPVDQR